MLDSIRLPGSARFGFVPINPSAVVSSGAALKSPISLLSRNPAPGTTIFVPKLAGEDDLVRFSLIVLRRSAAYGFEISFATGRSLLKSGSPRYRARSAYDRFIAS